MAVSRVFRAGRHAFALGQRTQIMGVLNVTPDSFSDGGCYVDSGAVLSHVRRMVEEGADIIDIGAESTRPGYKPLPAREEWRRLEEPLRLIRDWRPDVCISVDTQKAWVADRALEAGADIINDIQGLSGDPDMLSVLAGSSAGLVMMFNREVPWDGGQVDIAAIADFFAVHTERALNAGVRPERILVDPGLGFAYGGDDSWIVLQALETFAGFGAGLLVGPSRKRFLGAVTGKGPADRDGATAAVCALAAAHRVDAVRVHNVGAVRDALAVADRWARHG